MHRARNLASFPGVLDRASYGFYFSPLALLTFSGVTLLASRAGAEEEAVRIAYAAPSSCRDEQVFVARLHTRTEHGRFADPGELARTFDVSLGESANAAGFAGGRRA